MRKLKQNKNIIIKKADKNSGIVIMNIRDYENKVNNMLTDCNVYTPVDNYEIYEIKHIADSLLRRINDAITLLINNIDISHAINLLFQLFMVFLKSIRKIIL